MLSDTELGVCDGGESRCGLPVVVVLLPADPGVLLPVLVLTEGPAVSRHPAAAAGLRCRSAAVPAGLERREESQSGKVAEERKKEN